MYSYVIDFGNGYGKLVSVCNGKREEVIIDYLESELINAPEPEWPWNSHENREEYRMYNPKIDDHTNELIRNMSSIYSRRWNIPFKDSYRLINLAYCQGWKLKDVIKVDPVTLEKFLIELVKIDLVVMIQEMIESEEISSEEGQYFLSLTESLNFLPDFIDDYIIYKKNANFTGEVRLTEDDSEDDFEDAEENIPWNLLLNIVCVKSGKKAYEYSQQAKTYGSRVKKYLARAWELRRQLASLTPEERIKELRKLGIYW